MAHPIPIAECATYRKHMILDACLNITGDAVMLCLPIPLLVKARLPFARKCALIAVFSTGGLVILSAFLNRITNFTAPFGSFVYLNWYAAETATAVIVANLPHMWPLIALTFKLGTYSQNATDKKTTTGFTLQSIKQRNTFNLIGSEERIAGGAQEQWLNSSEDKLDLTGERGRSEAAVFTGGLKEKEHDSDAPRITKTMAVTQYTDNA